MRITLLTKKESEIMQLTKAKKEEEQALKKKKLEEDAAMPYPMHRMILIDLFADRSRITATQAQGQ